MNMLESTDNGAHARPQKVITQYWPMGAPKDYHDTWAHGRPRGLSINNWVHGRPRALFDLYLLENYQKEPMGPQGAPGAPGVLGVPQAHRFLVNGFPNNPFCCLFT